MKKEIEELTQRENNLVRVNQTLQKALKQADNKVDSQWKLKYEEQVESYHQLQKQLLEQTKNQHYVDFAPLFDSQIWETPSASPSYTPALSFERNAYSSVKKMDMLMHSLQGKEKPTSNYSSKRRRSSTFARDDEIIIRL
jgi:hypothetical protein